MEGRQYAHELCEFLRREVPGCERAFVASTAELVGVRETRRIVGDYRMDLDHYRARRQSADDIASYSYDVDVHVTGKSLRDIRARMQPGIAEHLKPGEQYGIPYRALIPQGVGNLLVVGRAISADRMMQGSVRCMPACFATGEAAGLAAAMAARGTGNVQEVDVRKLQRRLVRQGAFIASVDRLSAPGRRPSRRTATR
jgi:hypothetical protein